MAPVTNGRHLFNDFPTGAPEPGKTTVYDASQKIDLETVPLNGGFLLKTLVLSIDPYLRNRMSNVKSYLPPFEVGQPLVNFGVGVVLRSEHTGVKAGDHVYGFLSFEEYIVKADLTGMQIIQNEAKLPWSAYLGAAGMPGQTAFIGWKEYAHKAKKGDVIFITAGAGPVGSFVIQLAKSAGLKIISSAGSDEKVHFLKEIGADVAFNYKTSDTREVLTKEGPINFYWDNVGGESLEAAIDAAAVGATFIECGMVSGYNSGPQPLKNFVLIVPKALNFHGFTVIPLLPKYAQDFYTTVPARIAQGEIKYTEDIRKGLESVGEAIVDNLSGKNKGKVVIHVAEE